MAAAVNSCKKDVTAPESQPRTHSVATTVQVPRIPTAPITLTTNDPESSAQVTLDVATQQKIVQAYGSAVTIKMTDMAPVDFGTLAATESAQLGGPREAKVLVFDIQPTSSASLSLAGPAQGFGFAQSIMAQTAGKATMAFKVKNNTGTRCTPGKVDLRQIFGSSSDLLTSTLVIDDDHPLQNISGSSEDIVLGVRHFIFCFECPRVVPVSGAGFRG
jgi:hypothetical protein